MWGLVAWSLAYVLGVVLVCPHSSILSMGEGGFMWVVAFLVVIMLFSCV